MPMMLCCLRAPQLVCQYLSLTDVRSARLASQDWCRAASSAVTTAVLEAPFVTPGYLQDLLAAYPCCVRIICCSPETVQRPCLATAFDATSRQRPSESSSAGQEADRTWCHGAFALLVADSQPHPSCRSQAGSWSVVLKPSPTAGRSALGAMQDVWTWSLQALHYRTVSLLLHKAAGLSTMQVRMHVCGLTSALRVHCFLHVALAPGA